MSVLLYYFLCFYRRMSIIRIATRRLGDGKVNEEITSQVEKVLQSDKYAQDAQGA